MLTAFVGPKSWNRPNRSAFAKYWERTTSVRLVGPQYTDQDCDSLDQLVHLRLLTLRNTNVSADWRQSFKRRHPDCKIVVESTATEEPAIDGTNGTPRGAGLARRSFVPDATNRPN